MLELSARVDPRWPRQFLIGGFAVRRDQVSWEHQASASVAATLDDAERLVRAPV